MQQPPHQGSPMTGAQPFRQALSLPGILSIFSGHAARPVARCTDEDGSRDSIEMADGLARLQGGDSDGEVVRKNLFAMALPYAVGGRALCKHPQHPNIFSDLWPGAFRSL